MQKKRIEEGRVYPLINTNEHEEKKQARCLRTQNGKEEEKKPTLSADIQAECGTRERAGRMPAYPQAECGTEGEDKADKISAYTVEREIFKIKRPFLGTELFKHIAAVLGKGYNRDDVYLVKLPEAHQGLTTIVIRYKTGKIGQYLCGMLVWNGFKVCLAAFKTTSGKRFSIDPGYYDFIQLNCSTPYQKDAIESLLRSIGLERIEAEERTAESLGLGEKKEKKPTSSSDIQAECGTRERAGRMPAYPPAEVKASDPVGGNPEEIA